MNLSSTEIVAANNKRKVIQDHFLKGVRFCNHCGGTGLSNVVRSSDGDCSWDGISFCDKCNALGFLNWKETITEKLCPSCLGTGLLEKSNKPCPSCDKKGVVDWIRYIRLGGKREIPRTVEKNIK